MDEKINVEDILPLDCRSDELAQQIINEDNLEKTKELVDLFNLNQAKKNVLRVLKLNSLLDKVSDQMIERFEKTPDNFSNNDLLNYMQVTQSAIDRANKALNLVDETPAISITNNVVNVNDTNKLDKDSRDRITNAVKAILDKVKNIEENQNINLIDDGKVELKKSNYNVIQLEEEDKND